MAWLWRTRFRSHADSLRLLLSGDAAFRRTRRSRWAGGALRSRRRHCVRRRRVPCIPDLLAGNKYFRHSACGSGGVLCICASGPCRVRRAEARGHLAGLCTVGRGLGGGEIWPIKLGVAVSKRPSRLCVHRAAGVERCASRVCIVAAPRWNRVFDWLGAELGILCAWQLSRVWLHRHSIGDRHAFPCVRSPMARMDFFAVYLAGDFLFYGMAGRISLPRSAAKYTGAIEQERLGGLVDGVGAFWVFAHHEPRISELALCHSRDHRRDFLWLDLAQDRFDICVSDCARAGGYHVALLVSYWMRGCRYLD